MAICKKDSAKVSVSKGLNAWIIFFAVVGLVLAAGSDWRQRDLVNQAGTENCEPTTFPFDAVREIGGAVVAGAVLAWIVVRWEHGREVEREAAADRRHKEQIETDQRTVLLLAWHRVTVHRAIAVRIGVGNTEREKAFVDDLGNLVTALSHLQKDCDRKLVTRWQDHFVGLVVSTEGKVGVIGDEVEREYFRAASEVIDTYTQRTIRPPS